MAGGGAVAGSGREANVRSRCGREEAWVASSRASGGASVGRGRVGGAEASAQRRRRVSERSRRRARKRRANARALRRYERVEGRMPGWG